jgi:hypothetical protein
LGVALASYFNSHSDKSARKIAPGDFYGHHIPAPEQSDESMLAMMKKVTEAHNKTLKQKQG